MAEKKSYIERLKDPRWQKKRLEILQRDDFTCRSCGSKEDTLHVHHCYYVYGNDPWEYPEKSLVTLCCYCHSKEEMIKSIFSERIAAFINNGGLYSELSLMIAMLETDRDGVYTMLKDYNEYISSISNALTKDDETP